MKFYNLLILLTVLLFSAGGDVTGPSSVQTEVPQPREKGPVYHPLRERPYSKSTVNV